MRIIKPQQLSMLKGNYQLGQQSYMGISIIAGCYCSDPERFITETQMWQAWNAAPHLFPIMDSAEPKPYAEFLLAGHIERTQPVTMADASVEINGLRRQWQIVGDRTDAFSSPNHFTRMPLDHTHTWSGQDAVDNPTGKTLPNISLQHEEELNSSRAALAAPTPVPHDFPLRQNWLQQVQAEMNSEEYLETVFPGLPTALDHRYFQLAPPDQWLTQPEWPAEVSLTLQGFNDDQTMACTLPAVKAIALAQRTNGVVEEISLQRKTLWLLPDSNIILMIFTGSLPLTHLLDEPFETLLCGLDHAQPQRPVQHFSQVMAQRLDKNTSQYASLYDPDLMPQGMRLDVITDTTQHPNSLRYSGPNANPEATTIYYQQLRELIDNPDYQPQKTSMRPFDWGRVKMKFSPMADIQNTDQITEKSFSSLTFSTLRNKHFSQCRFFDCFFSTATIESCQFENCSFERTHWKKMALNQVIFLHTTFSESTFNITTWDNISLKNVSFDHCRTNQFSLISSLIKQSNFNQCKLIQFDLNNCRVENCTFDGTVFNTSKFAHCTLSSALFNLCQSNEMHFSHCNIEKSSLIGCEWLKMQIDESQLDCVTTGLSCDFSHLHITQCWMKRCGLSHAKIPHLQMRHTTAIETNFDQSDLRAAHIEYCDLTGIRLKDTQLTDSTLCQSSLQQGLLYNAQLERTLFIQCNLAGANLAMITRNAATVFDDCLIDAACWLPQRTVKIS